jgi:YidC/Oxa1 family membrane protein insertase
MQMDFKRLLLSVVFAFSLFMLWENWVRYTNPPKPATPVATQGADQSGGLPTPMATPGAPAAAQAPVVAAGGTDYAAYPKAVIKTDTVVAEVSALGGDIYRLELEKHRATGDKTRNFVLLENKGVHTYLAQSGLLGQGLPNHKTVFVLESNAYTLQPGQDQLVVRMKAPADANGVAVTKVLTFHRDSYLVDVAYELTNGGSAPLNATAYFQLVRDGAAAEHSAGLFGGVSTFTGPAFYTQEGKFQKVKFTDIDKKDAKFVKSAKDGWVAMIQHYFVSAWLPKESTQRDFFVDTFNGLYSAGVKVPVTVAPGQTATVDVPLYAGPQEQNNLKKIAPGLDVVVDYGWVTIIAAPLFWLLSFIHSVLGNWGWSIILVTIIIKAVFFPLSAASYKSMARMKTLMPRMKQIQERYASDKMRMNQEMMSLYKTEKVNPMGGCLPIVIQIPVFIALYWVLLGVVEMRQAPWIGWITDLSTRDPYFILPLIMGATMFIQQRLNPTPPDPIQAKVMMLMPIFFTAMFLWFPAGLVLYWVVNNSLSILQQWYITRSIERGKKAANS